jgi:hypothetical protein
MVEFYHAVDHLFVRSPYKGVLQRAHIMTNREQHRAERYLIIATSNWVQTGLKRQDSRSEKYSFSYTVLQIKLTMNFLAFSRHSQVRFCPLVILYEISSGLNTIVNNIHGMNV